jgi:predicted CoA-substrate-specific enzyme activase
MQAEFASTSKTILGLDIGSVGLSIVEIDAGRRIRSRAYAFHHGRIEETLGQMLDAVALERVGWVASTSSTTKGVLSTASYDSHVALITAAKHLHGRVGSILLLGGEKFSLVRFDAQGDYLETKTNSGCAAGTGSFLDEQARNLGLASGAELSATALAAQGDVPKVASRCAVFAKTDIIHAQQEGYSREAICRGLCNGLATIIFDTLFAGEAPSQPVVLAGGLALNGAVVRHLSSLVGCDLLVDDLAPYYGALGAALLLRADLDARAQLRGKMPGSRLLMPKAFRDVRDIYVPAHEGRVYVHEPLTLDMSSYPDFRSERHDEFAPRVVEGAGVVEVDIYVRTEPGQRLGVRMGIDIGSTSTKAVLLGEDRTVVAGFYTRTQGRPVAAAQALLEAMSAWAAEAQVELRVLAAGTTGSGRKLVGSLLGADLVVDEITAHARAACELDPEVDTIIEIGGQDAKFTTLRNGMVTSAVMNTVCAAGTGSFIEEQARRLGCSLSSYARLVEGARSPMASDRCTVFMQRDVNHLLASGYEVSEILAAVLHSVRENYLQKVAREGAIGRRICFQGATARNKALVAAFEQKLGRPIAVSRYCHLTGALGVALQCADKGITQTRFRGLGLYRERIPLRKETCELCRNHCKIVKAEVRGEVSAYGYLCGRDYDTPRHVSNNRSGFDLDRERGRVCRVASKKTPGARTIGIPAALFLVEDLPLWKSFFQRLGLNVLTSDACPDPVSAGKRLARAEFCAPMAAFHGHVAFLADKVDYLFVPYYLEADRQDRETRRQYCYYSQYAPALVQTLPGELRGKCLTPMFTDGAESFQSMARLFASLREAMPGQVGFAQLAAAHREAVQEHRARKQRLQAVMQEQLRRTRDISVVLLGRPYTCLPVKMNKRIPELFGKLGIQAFYQDMLSFDPEEVTAIDDLLHVVHWNYAARILQAAEVVANRDGLYPVLVTSFKCAPDSCTIEYFRRILDARGKPYLILELDEHESSVGYETRIEAAVGAFRNHHRTRRPTRLSRALRTNPSIVDRLDGKTLVIPSWDRLSGELLVANLRHEGVNAVLMNQDTLSIQKSLRLNTGQCIPLTAIVQGFIDTVRQMGLDPASTVLWSVRSRLSCNIGGFTGVIQNMLEQHGEGFERVSVYQGEITFVDISLRAGINTYFAYMFGGLLRRLVCRIRPYEKHPGETDRVLEQSLDVLREAFLQGRDKLEAVEEVVNRFASIPRADHHRPKIAVFGDLYTRDNDVMNQDLVRFIEQHGGEVVTTPYSVYGKLVADLYVSRWIKEGQYKTALVSSAILAALRRLERKYDEQFCRILGPSAPAHPNPTPAQILERFWLTDRHAGESMDNLLEIYHVLQTVPDVSLFVMAAPAFCCPSLVTEAMSRRISEATGVPIVTVTYDGTASSKNEAIIPYLKYPRQAAVQRTRASRI